jgi:hypothetical protein
MMHNPHSRNNVVITKKEYEYLLQSDFKLQCLEEGGVDNWQWYFESLEPFRRKYYPEDYDDAPEE